MPEAKDIIIFGASASVFESDRERVKLVGCNDFLPKPVNYGRLLEMLDSHLQLEWLYEDEQEKPEDQEHLEDEIQNLKPALSGAEGPKIQNLMPPPPEEIVVLFDLSMKGNIPGIRKRAIQIAQMDKKYKPFADKLQQLAKAYAEDEILALVEQYMEEGIGD